MMYAEVTYYSVSAIVTKLITISSTAKNKNKNKTDLIWAIIDDYFLLYYIDEKDYLYFIGRNRRFIPY